MTDPVAMVAPSGDVVVSASVAAQVLDVVRQAARNGARITPEVSAVAGALGEAARRRVTLSTVAYPNGEGVVSHQNRRVSEVEIGTTEAASLLRCSTESVRRLVSSGALPGHLVGKTWLIDRSAVVALREKKIA
jgi:excisionase family DNA binding protein